ncbi:magnesium chelatase domain-containing protein [Streptomyces sp. NPDC096538]|uniref:magnesium chelatase domain-containing protein n=1 Tax=Streptomyces sp. NPDC096538 TaxID=3155427 RepID=UPI00332B23CC
MTIQTEQMTAALSHATEVARQRAFEARTSFHRITLDYAASLLRETLPDAAAVTIDSDDGDLYEVRDADGKALYRAPFTPASPLTDDLADDVSDLFRQVLPLGGLTEAGWETAAEGLPYLSIPLPAPDGAPAARPTDSPLESRAVTRFATPEGTGTVLARIWPQGSAAVVLGVDHGRETRDRVRAAIHNSGYLWPAGTVHVQVGGDDSRTHGTLTDLAIACAILAAAGQIPKSALERTALTGELDLAGWLRAPAGVDHSVQTAAANGIAEVIAPDAASDQLHQLPVDPATTVHAATCLPEAAELLARK